MRKSIGSSVLLFALSLILKGQTLNEPSLNDTLSWILNTMSTYRGIIPATLSYNRGEECSVTLNMNDMWIYRMKLGDLEPNLRVREIMSGEERSWGFDLSSRNNQRSILGPHQAHVTKVSVDFYDDQIARRVATAFSHAIELCGGKISTF